MKIVGRVLNDKKDSDTAFKDEDFSPEAVVSPKVADATPPAEPFRLRDDPFRAKPSNR